MRCNPFGWLLGLPVLALVWGLAVKGERAHITADLQQRTTTALHSQELDWARVRFNLTEGEIVGAAYSIQEQQRAISIAKRIWGVWSIQDRSALIEKAPNYVWGAAVRDDNLHLSGFVPNEKTRRQILEVAKQQFPQLMLHDDMRPARGVPSREIWVDGVSFGLQQLTQLKQGGEVQLTGTKLGISGEAESVAAYQTIKGDVARRLPSGILLAKDEVTPPRISPYTWRAAYKANQVEISGYVPPGKIRDMIMQIASEAFPKTAIVYKLQAASGAPEGWLKVVSTILRAMPQLVSAVAAIEDRTVNFEGLAVQEITSERTASALQVGMPDKYTLKHQITFQQPTLPTISPFTTTMVSDGERVSLTGFAPDESARQRLVAAAKQKFPARQIVDALTYANGAPAGWQTCAESGIFGLSQLERGRAELTDVVLRLAGETSDEAAAARLPAEVRASANRACKDTIEIKVLTPPEPDLKWQATSIDNRIELSGEVTDSDTKSALLNDAGRLFPKYQLVDNMRVNPARSTKWAKVVKLGLEQLGQLRSGLVQLNGQILTLDGIAADTAVAAQVKNRIERGVTAGYSGEVNIEVKSDAMIWSEQEAKRKSEAAAEKTRLEQLEEAKRAAALQVVQKRAAEAAAQARREAEARELAKQNQQQKPAAAKQKPENEPKRRNEQAANATASEVARKPNDARDDQGPKRRDAITPKQKEISNRCTEQLNQATEQGTIRFEVGSNRLSPESTSTLDKLIKIYEACPGAQLEIGGHTDSSGSAEANLKLSQSRAEAVLDYFVNRGLPRDKFIARGYGETKPRSANDSAANRARNRRIEFGIMTN